MSVLYRLSRTDNSFCFIPKKRNGREFFCEYRNTRLCEVTRAAILFPERLGQAVDGLVGTLRRENNGGKKLERGTIGKLAFGLGVGAS